jgi:hypothetical protein
MRRPPRRAARSCSLTSSSSAGLWSSRRSLVSGGRFTRGSPRYKLTLLENFRRHGAEGVLVGVLVGMLVGLSHSEQSSAVIATVLSLLLAAAAAKPRNAPSFLEAVLMFFKKAAPVAPKDGDPAKGLSPHLLGFCLGTIAAIPLFIAVRSHGYLAPTPAAQAGRWEDAGATRHGALRLAAAERGIAVREPKQAATASAEGSVASPPAAPSGTIKRSLPGLGGAPSAQPSTPELASPKPRPAIGDATPATTQDHLGGGLSGGKAAIRCREYVRLLGNKPFVASVARKKLGRWGWPSPKRDDLSEFRAIYELKCENLPGPQ